VRVRNTRSQVAILTLLAATTACNAALVPDSVMYSLGAEAYTEATGQYPVIENTADARMVERVGRKIAEASGKSYQWEFKLLDAPSIPNAFCLPGGKIAVYTGILPLTQTEDGLAAVLGHEVAHATLEHGNRRMTQSIGVNGAMIIIDAYLAGNEGANDEYRNEIMMALGAGVQYGLVLPYSRSHESEADAVGLRYLVRAGYDPNEAPRLWERMAAAFPNQQPEFMSTHPDSLARAQRLRELIPVVLAEETSGTP